MGRRRRMFGQFGQPRGAVVIEDDRHSEVRPCLECNFDCIDLEVSLATQQGFYPLTSSASSAPMYKLLMMIRRRARLIMSMSLS